MGSGALYSTPMKPFKQICSGALTPQTAFWLGLSVLALPNVCLAYTEPLPLVSRLVGITLPLSVYAALLTLWRKPGRTLWWLFPLVFLSAFQMVLLYLYGHSVIAVDMFLNLVTTNPNEAGELLNNLLPGMVFVIVLYVPTLLLSAISGFCGGHLSANFTHKVRRSAGILGIVGLCLAGFALANGFRPSLHLYPLNVFENIRLAIVRTQRTAHYQQTAAQFKFHATPTHPNSEREIYVLVIGETARAPQFRLYGYPRNTSPLLSALPSLYAFDHTLSQSNTTHKSVPMLLSPVSAINYDSIYTRKSLLTAFREAGFHTVYLSNQLPNHSFIDFFGQQANQWRFIKEGKPDTYDGYDQRLLPLVDSVLTCKRQKQLIVLHTYGSHFEYRKRYPHNEGAFFPDENSDAKLQNRVELVNAYNNTILQTDRLLAALISRISSTGASAALLYASDHGENIFDDARRLFLHASPVPSYYELHVPLLVWLSPRYAQLQPAVVTALRTNLHQPVSTSVSVFHTFAHLAGLRSPWVNVQSSVASPTYQPQPWLYLDDHNRAVPLLQMLRSPLDTNILRQKGFLNNEH